jgi:choline-sulfatase
MQFLRRAVFGAAGLGVLVAACREAPEPREPLSVLLIVVDTLRADHLGVYGYERPTSPELDRWAARGRVFEHAQAPSSWTLPSMASLMTGQLPDRHTAGVERDAGGEIVRSPRHGRKDFRILPSSVETLAEILAQADYATAAFVTNVFLGRRFGFAQGFDSFDHHSQARAADVIDTALAYFAEDPGGPTFVYVHLFDPHLPYGAGAPFAGRFTADCESSLELPVKGLSALRKRASELPDDERDFITAAYDEEIAYVDHHVGRLLDELDRSGALDSTLVVLTSDHGEELFDHGGFEHGHTMYQELLHVPLFVWHPDLAPGRVEAPASLLDVTTTILDAAGVRPRTPLQGRSLLRDTTPTTVVSAGNLYGPEQRALLRWPHKLIDGDALEVFDLSTDAAELSPLSADGLRERMSDELDARVDAARALAPGASQADLDEETLEHLRDLGYVDR